MSFLVDFENILYDNKQRAKYVWFKIISNLLFVSIPPFITFVIYSLLYYLGIVPPILSFWILSIPFILYLISGSENQIKVILRSVDLHADKYFNFRYNFALIFEIFLIFIWVYIFNYSINTSFDLIFVVISLYFTGVIMISLLNFKWHLAQRLIPFSKRPVISYFLEIPQYKFHNKDSELRQSFDELTEECIIFEKIPLPPLPYMELSKNDYLNLFLFPLTYILVLPIIDILNVPYFNLWISILLIISFIVLSIWYLLKVLNLESFEEVKSTCLILSFLVSTTAFNLFYYLMSLNKSFFLNFLNITINKFNFIIWIRFHIIVSTLIALLTTLLVVELPARIVISSIKDRVIESKRADISKIENELNKLINLMIRIPSSNNIHLIEIYKEKIRILLSQKLSIENEITRIEESPSSPVPLLDKILSGGILGLIVLLFTSLV